MSTWSVARKEGRCGTGNWEAFDKGFDSIAISVRAWKQHLTGIKKGWLCWHLDDQWCKVQQRLILNAGWTPIVGGDSSCGNKTILEGSVYLNFNEQLKLPCMWMHFPLEFVFLFIDKLAFWHSDFICSIDDMSYYSEIFSNLKDGETAAVKHLSGWKGFKDPFTNHFGELVGCTTKGASEDQYNKGCGWWRHIECHPNRKVHGIQKVYYEHGTGIYIWNKKFNGRVRTLMVNEEDGHATV